MIKILYDHQIFSSQKVGGISRYFCELIRRIALDRNFESELSIVVSNNVYLKDYNVVKYIDFPKRDFRGKIRLMNYVNKIKSIKRIKSKQYDIFHPTYYDPYFLKYLNGQSFVLTIHDMIHEIFPEFFSKNDKTSYKKKLLANKTSRIIAVSKNTKKDIVKILGIDESKIDVVYHGSNFDKIEEDKEFKNKLPTRYILFTGNRGGYKNFKNFIKAISEFLINENLYLICAGGGCFTKEENDLFNSLNIKNKILRFDCNDNQLKTLFRNALFFIFPSLYEGFGIPLLEAMGSDCPILCSNTSCFPEIVKDSAIYFDPYDIDDIKEKINYALKNDLSEYIEKGKKRFKDFSWDKAREKTKKVYEKVL